MAADPLTPIRPRGLQAPDSLAAPATAPPPLQRGNLPFASTTDPLDAPGYTPPVADLPPADDPSDERPRFISRADLGETLPPPTSTPVADLPFADSAVCFTTGGAAARPVWTADGTDGVPTGLPPLIDPPSEAPEAEPQAPPAPREPSATSAADEESSDVFALPDESEEVNRYDTAEWTLEESLEAPMPELASDAPRPTAVLSEADELRAELASARSFGWVLLVVGLLVGFGLGALFA